MAALPRAMRPRNARRGSAAFANRSRSWSAKILRSCLGPYRCTKGTPHARRHPPNGIRTMTGGSREVKSSYHGHRRLGPGVSGYLWTRTFGLIARDRVLDRGTAECPAFSRGQDRHDARRAHGSRRQHGENGRFRFPPRSWHQIRTPSRSRAGRCARASRGHRRSG
jgi:hypothetical protein